MRYCLLSLFLITLWSVEEPITVTVVTEDEARKDVNEPQWVLDIPTNGPQGLSRHVVVAVGSPALPIPTTTGVFRQVEWEAFIAAEFNPSRNAIRLAGYPDVIQVGTQEIHMEWRMKILSSDQGTPKSLILDITPDGKQVTWSYKIELPPIPKM